ncbi:MAG TPA: Crp/Fnr family transcriptional regulator [Clostridia bacterium]|nr:Crp/Fnr family transcriptional regulator [Clostridia bacterium]
MKTMLDVVSEQPLFKDLRPEHLRSLAENARFRTFRPGEIVFRNGDLAKRFYVVISGRIDVEATTEAGQPVRLQTTGPGELLGWSWNFSNSIRQLHARAAEPTEVIYFRGDPLRRQCDQDHDLGYELFRRVSEQMMQRLQATRRVLLAQTSLPVTTSRGQSVEK